MWGDGCINYINLLDYVNHFTTCTYISNHHIVHLKWFCLPIYLNKDEGERNNKSGKITKRHMLKVISYSTIWNGKRQNLNVLQ